MSASEHITQHYAAHIAHQQQVWGQALQEEGFDSAVVHAGSAVVSFLDDYHYPFRPNPHFLAWLPLTHHQESVLIVRPGAKPVLYFYQPEDYWYLPPQDPEPWWAGQFEIRPMREPGEWRSGVPLGREAYLGDAPDILAEGDLNPRYLLNRLHLGRTRKTPYEIACITEAGNIAARAHLAAAQAFDEGCSEYEIHQRYLLAAQLEDPQLPYNNIVALNSHGAVLHYQQREHALPAERHSFLIDAGATVHAYCADITRSYSAQPGVFADLIQALDGLQQTLCDGMRPGVDYRDMHLAAHRGIAELLRQADIITADADEAVESGLTGVFYPHGLGHFLGLQTHDVAGLISDAMGTEIPRPRGHPFLRLTRTLEPGNVLTVEPGIYFIDSLLKRWQNRNGSEGVNWNLVDALKACGGVRIEDNVLVTESQPLNLSRRAFARLATAAD